MTVRRRIARIERLRPPRSVVQPAPSAAVAATLRLAEMGQAHVFDPAVVAQVQQQRATNPRTAAALNSLDRLAEGSRSTQESEPALSAAANRTKGAGHAN